MSPLDSLLTALAGAPALPGARCRGRAHLFDEGDKHEAAEVVEQRHTQAVGLCEHCPSLDRCRTWVDSLPARQRPRGVVAGRQS
jgi:WhiB family transcriptional regulator, redox-sensing transcriptional regulator